MNDTKYLIEKYARSDFETRLNMFLSYRSLRRRFSEIDDKQRQKDKLPCRSEKGAWVQRLIWRWMGA